MDVNNPLLVAVVLNTVLIAIAFLLPKKLLTPAGLSQCLAAGRNCLDRLWMAGL